MTVLAGSALGSACSSCIYIVYIFGCNTYIRTIVYDIRLNIVTKVHLPCFFDLLLDYNQNLNKIQDFGFADFRPK